MQRWFRTITAGLLLMGATSVAWAGEDGVPADGDDGGASLLAEGDALMQDLGEGDPKGAIAKYQAAAKVGADEFEEARRMRPQFEGQLAELGFHTVDLKIYRSPAGSI